MPLWIVLLIVGVILAILGFTGIGHLLIWIGIIVLIVGLIGILVGRGRRGV